jgi:serine protease Do
MSSGPPAARANPLVEMVNTHIMRSSSRVFPLLFVLGTAAFSAGCQKNVQPGSAANAPAQPVASETPPPAGTFVAPLVQPVQVVGQSDVAGLVERLKPTVVNITTSRAVARTSMNPFDGTPFGGMLPPFGGPGGAPPEARAHALGTGFIVDPAGYVVTNAHVISGAEDIQVRLSDDRELSAHVVGKDTKLDLALVKIDGASNLSAAVLGDSDQLRVGEWVLAIGNPFGLGHTVTLGITSAKDRSIGAGPYDAFIQTDASINPGNSGGPLFNLKGEVVGIPTAIRQGAQGIGFAVPVNSLKDVLPQLRDKGTVSRGKLGVRIQHITADLAKGLGLDRARGALVANVETGSAGARAGLQPGDVIVQVDGSDVARSEELPRLVARHAPGSEVRLTYLRNGKQGDTKVVLDALTEDPEGDEGPAVPSPGKAQEPASKLGVQLDDAPQGGARIRGVAPGSPAFGQLSPGDVVLEINRQPVKSASEMQKRIEQAKSGDILLLRVRRGHDQRFVGLKLR